MIRARVKYADNVGDSIAENISETTAEAWIDAVTRQHPGSRGFIERFCSDCKAWEPLMLCNCGDYRCDEQDRCVNCADAPRFKPEGITLEGAYGVR